LKKLCLLPVEVPRYPSVGQTNATNLSYLNLDNQRLISNARIPFEALERVTQSVRGSGDVVEQAHLSQVEVLSQSDTNPFVAGRFRCKVEKFDLGDGAYPATVLQCPCSELAPAQQGRGIDPLLLEVCVSQSRCQARRSRRACQFTQDSCLFLRH